MTADIAAPAAYDTALLGLRQKSVAPPNMKQLDETAREFEAMFVSEMMAHMFEGLDADPMFGGGQGEEMFRSMLVQEYGKLAAQGPGLGISGQIKSMMIEMQQTKGV